VSWDRLWESVHGHLGVLAAIALLHPAILLRDGRPLTRGLRSSVGLSTALTGLAFAFGVASYDSYRELVKRDLFLLDPAAGLLFETKEHLAYVTLALAIGAGAAALLAPASATGTRRMAARVYAAAALGCLTVVALGTWVASVRGF
jgi:hypothetical protein